ncbi:unnamed protein product [Rotaria sp. Silwood2]|nr:unnamed protein product [Rotaria sp. Silwood2]CAF3393260.1 unnamed protein product [Rotaria sp. Silwood2]CAF3417537.1 unnamed protein product [Rotaria sp. Silwood2]CAF4477264.1 unnamed protein product [Rotaria sp. Silwood2]CAF4492110.1 unnamed protein product [Rotaria sp. Silwood2]
MDDRLMSFDEEFQPQITNTLNTIVDHIQETVNKAEPLSADDAEKMLDDACDDCINTFKTKIEEIRASARRARPDPSSQTYDEDEKMYTAYITAVATGIEQSKSFFDTVFERIRNIVSTVVECIKAGVKWAWDQLTAAFDSIKSLYKS